MMMSEVLLMSLEPDELMAQKNVVGNNNFSQDYERICYNKVR